jgi:hypothetical protein
MMKKLFLIVGVVMLGLTAQAQQYVENYSFFQFTAADTMTIQYGDKVYDVAVSVPSGATDSAVVDGMPKTISGIVANGWKLAPGENVNIGTGISPINWCRIIIRANSKARIATMSPGKK